MSKETGNR